MAFSLGSNSLIFNAVSIWEAESAAVQYLSSLFALGRSLVAEYRSAQKNLKKQELHLDPNVVLSRFSIDGVSRIDHASGLNQ